MSQALLIKIENDPIAFVKSLTISNLRMFATQAFPSYFINNFFGYSSLKKNFRYIPIIKLKPLAKLDSSTDDELINFIDKNFDLFYEDLLKIIAGLDEQQQTLFINNIPDEELRRLFIESSPDTVKGGFYRVSKSTLDNFLKEAFETISDEETNFWVGIK